MIMDMQSLLKKLEKHVTRTGKLRAEKNIPPFISLMEGAEKLAARCIYLQVISTSDKHLLKVLLEKGGWSVLYDWLKEAKSSDNIPFVLELLKIYVKLPVTLKLMKQNSTAKLINGLGKHQDSDVKHRAQKIVHDWKKIVREKPSEDEKPAVPSGPQLFDVSSDNVRVSVHKTSRSSTESKPSPGPAVSQPSGKHKAAVKTAPAKFRPTGFEDEMKTDYKPSPKPVKRPSDQSLQSSPANTKRSKTDSVSLMEAHNKIVLPKPKPIHESSGFMDALASSAVQPTKKGKRRPSKDGKPSTPVSPNQPTPPSFYRDTMSEGRRGSDAAAASPVGANSPNSESRGEGVLREPCADSSAKRVSWAEDKSLVQVQYFEMDTSERVNVNRLSWDQLQRQERMLEGKAFHQRDPPQLSRPINDRMKTSIQWRVPPVISDLAPPSTPRGEHSTERAAQMQRETQVLAAIFFNKFMLPESPFEPDAEAYEPCKPTLIPLEDVSGESPVQTNGSTPVEAYDPETEYNNETSASSALPSELSNLLKPKEPLLTADGHLNPAASVHSNQHPNHSPSQTPNNPPHTNNTPHITNPQINLGNIDVNSIMNIVNKNNQQGQRPLMDHPRDGPGGPPHGHMPPMGHPDHGPRGPMDHGPRGPMDHGPRGPMDHGPRGPPDHGPMGPHEHGARGPMDHGPMGPDHGPRGPPGEWGPRPMFNQWNRGRGGPPRSGRDTICRFFANGFCSFGEQCKFRHTVN